MAPKTYVSRNAFNAGEVSGLVAFRSDVQKYESACLTLENAVPLVEGGAKKMPGTYFAGSTGDGGAIFIGSIAGTTLTITKVIFGTIRIGQTVTGPGITPGTVITAYIPTSAPLTTYYNVTRNASAFHYVGDWEYVGAEFRTHFEPITTALSDLNCSSFGFAIPTTASILGISVGTSIISQFPTTSVLSQTQLWSSGGPFGTLKTPNTPFTTYFQNETYGDGTDLWGSPASPTIVNDPSFGFALAVATDTSRVFISDTLQMTVYYSITTMVTSGQPGGLGDYTVSIAHSIGSEQMQTGSNGKSRLVPFQFSTEQGAFLEFSAGIIRIWEGATQGDWSLGLALQAPPTALNYNPATAYIPGNLVLVGPSYPMEYFHLPGGNHGRLTIFTPYGTTNATSVPITIAVNTIDTLSVTVTGSTPNQGINILLASTTAANNADNLVQAAIRALGSLNTITNNYVDLSAWVAAPDIPYHTLPLTNAPNQFPGWYNVSWVAQCVVANQFDQTPNFGVDINSSFWEEAATTQQLPIELVTPYTEADLFALDCSTQSADVLWVFHSSYPPAVIERQGANIWAYSLSLPGQQPGEPPYRGTLDVVQTGYTGIGESITKITKTNPCVVTVAASTNVLADGNRVYMNLIGGMVELNQGEFLVSGSTLNGDGTFSFSLTDPNTGNPVDSTGYLAYVSGGFVVQVVPFFAVAGDYPACGTLYQERLCVGGSTNKPTTMHGSVQGDYPDFVADPNQEDFAIQFTLVSNKLDQILNMVGTPNSLLLGSAGGVWVMAGANGGSLSQTNVNAAKQTSMGVSPLQPQLIDGSAIFVSRSTRIVNFLLFDFATDQWSSNDLTRLNRSITLGPTEAMSGIVQTAFQTEPYPIFWAVRADGQLIGLVFNRQDQVYAWFRVKMPTGVIESAAVISGADQEDQMAVVVARTINGMTMRYVEYFMPQELFSQLSNSFFVHCGLQWTGLPSVPITNITNASPAVVTSPGHGFSNGMFVQITGVAGDAESGMPQVNQVKSEAYVVQAATTTTFQLYGALGGVIDSTAWGVYTSGGTVRQVKNQVSGMNYLLGQEYVAVGDGQYIQPPTYPPTLVTSDTVTFPYYANQITIGIPYDVTIQPTDPTLSSQGATTRGMPQKLSRVTVSLYESMGGKFGVEGDFMYPLTYDTGSQSQLPTLFTGEVTRDIDCDWTDRSTLYIQQSEPFPFTLRGLVMRMSVNQD